MSGVSSVLSTVDAATELLVVGPTDGGGEMDKEGPGFADCLSLKVAVWRRCVPAALSGTESRSDPSDIDCVGVTTGELASSVLAAYAGLGLRSIDGIGD